MKIKTFLNLFFVMLLLPITVKAQKESLSVHRVWVYLKTRQDIKKLKEHLKSTPYIIHAASGRFILLDSKISSEFSKDDFKKLESLSYVNSAGFDEILKTKVIDNACLNTKSDFSVNISNDILKIASKTTLKYNCSLSKMCDNDSFSYNWHQLYTDSDLMLEELKSSPANSTVIVLDTGYEDLPMMTLDSKKVSSSKNTIDTVGHGTAVMSIIGSRKYKEGLPALGISPYSSLNLIRYQNGSSTNSIASSLLILKEACEKNKDPLGIVFLNLSANTAGDESGVKPMESYYSDYLKDIESAGCMLVLAAGNDKMARSKTHDNEDDNLVRVGAIDQNGKSTSTQGEIQAPGEFIAVLGAGEMLINSPEIAICDKGVDLGKGFRLPTISVSGSSFSTPIVTSILSNIQLALKKYDKYSKLNKKDQIILLNRILFNSIVANSVNGFKALKLAEAWGKSNLEKVPLKQELINLLNKDNEGFCSSDVPMCDATSECATKQTCISITRKRLILCPEGANSASEKLHAAKLKLNVLNIFSDNPMDAVYLKYKLDNLLVMPTQEEKSINDNETFNVDKSFAACKKFDNISSIKKCEELVIKYNIVSSIIHECRKGTSLERALDCVGTVGYFKGNASHVRACYNLKNEQYASSCLYSTSIYKMSDSEIKECMDLTDIPYKQLLCIRNKYQD